MTLRNQSAHRNPFMPQNRRVHSTWISSSGTLLFLTLAADCFRIAAVRYIYTRRPRKLLEEFRQHLKAAIERQVNVSVEHAEGQG